MEQQQPQQQQQQQQQSRSSSTTTLVPNETEAGALKNLTNTIINLPRQAANGPDMPQLAPGLSPQPVGREFVRQYYTVMSKSPEMLHRFYAANSTLTYCNSPPIVGQEEIRKDIEKRCLTNCHTRILKVDAQPTLANGVVVQVVGELSNNNEPLRSFTQTFVLTPLVPKNFFVYNEIFRYQDDVQSAVNLEPLKMDHAIGAVASFMAAPTELWLPSTTIRGFSPVLTRQVIAISKSIASIAIQTANETAANGENERLTVPQALQVEVLVQPLKTTAETQTATETQTSAELNLPTVVAAAAVEVENIPQSVEENEESPKVDEQAETANTAPETITTPATLTQPTTTILIPKSPPTPTATPTASVAAPVLTYATVFKSSSAQSLSSVKPTAIPPTPTPECELQSDVSTTYIPSATFTTSTSGTSSPSHTTECRSEIGRRDGKLPESSINSTAQPNQSHSYQNDVRRNRYDSARRSFESNGGRSVRSGNATTMNSGNTAAYNTQPRRQRPQYDRYDDNLQLFLGNLPLSATVEELTQIFERYGSILELRVLSKSSQPGQRKLPNYGFLTYATTEAVKRCLSDLPFYFPENSDKSVRLNVRPKSEASIASPTQQQQKQQQPSRAGKYNFRFDSGGDQIRTTDQPRYRRLLKRDGQEMDGQRNGGGEASNVTTASTTHSRSSPDTLPTVQDDWPELSAASSGGGTYRKGNKK